MIATFRWPLFFIVFNFFSASLLFAQVAIPSVKPAYQTSKELASIRSQIDLTNSQTNLVETEKQNILNTYQDAENNLLELQEIEQQIQETRQQLQQLPTKIKQLENNLQIADDQSGSIEKDLSQLSVDELEERLVIEKSKLNDLKSSINQLEEQFAEQLNRPKEVRQQIAAIKETLALSQQELAAIKKTSKNKYVREARETQITTLQRKLQANLSLLDLENLVHPLSLEANSLELQWTKSKYQQLSRLVEHMEDLLAKKEQQEIDRAQQALIQQQKAMDGKHPALQTVAKENLHYSQLLRELDTKKNQYLEFKKQIDNRYEQLKKDFQSAEKKIDLADINPSLGNILRKQKRDLPLAKNYQEQFDIIYHEAAQYGIAQLQLEDIEKRLSDIDSAVQNRVAAENFDQLDDAKKLQLSKELAALLNEQKKLIPKLMTAYAENSEILADIDVSLQQLITLGEKFDNYLSERLLWIPSAPVIDKQFMLEFLQSMQWISQVSHWQQLLIDFHNSIKSKPILSILGSLIIGLLIIYRRKIKNDLESLLAKSRKIYADRFIFTFYAIGYVFLLVIPLPLLMAFSGWLILKNSLIAPFSHAVADGLITAALPLLIMQFFYLLFKPQGVAQSMLDWQEHSIHLLRRQLKWLRVVAIPVMFLIGMFTDQVDSVHSYTLGRMAFIVAMLAMTYVMHRFAHPDQGLGKDFYQQNPSSWISRLRYLWYAILILTPLVIMGFALSGYYQSALELQRKFVILLRLLFLSALLHSIVLRWLLLANRRLALQNARQKRQLQEQADGAGKEKTGIQAVNPEEALLLDIPKINEQSKKLLNAAIFAFLVVGSGLVLRDLFPALSIFEKVVLWQHEVVIDGQVTLQPVTLVNLFMCFVYFLVMVIFVRNFPGLIDLFCVGKFRLSAGSRYAIIQLTGYAVVMITLIAIADELGGSWSQVQWLVAAMGVGLGFGLQEIFANMVSGIILLFERPIRVGDTVTVGDVSGKVSRIQIRATTIVDWDQKELIVPNKMFITDRLVNWTLTDTITRLVIPVGIAYDADEAQAARLMMQAMIESPYVLKEPEPSVFFLGFGESSLDFSLRAFVSNMEDRLPAIDDIHRRVRQTFKEHNIEIPFPQRDLHIRSSALTPGQQII